MSHDQPAISVLIVDDQRLVRAGFAVILGTESDITVVGEAGDGAEAVALARQLSPDVVLMDIRMPNMDGLEATRIVLSDTACRVLILTTFDTDEYVYAALRAGASGFLLKDAQPADLLSAIRAVASGDAVVAPSITRRLLDTYAHRLGSPGDGGPSERLGPLQREQLAQLTAREHEVLLLVARSMSNAEIAERLVLSEATVKSHVGRILAKLDLRDRVQIVVFAYESGLVTPARG
jgi:DNA-binding NarL/FixJ family response regulator